MSQVSQDSQVGGTNMTAETRKDRDLEHGHGRDPKQSIAKNESLYWTRGAQKNTEISVGGIKVKVRTDATPNHLKLVRELVESRFDMFSDRLTKGISTQQLTVLVAFNLAEELLKERSKTKFLKKTVVECTEKLLNRVESFLQRRSGLSFQKGAKTASLSKD